MKRTVSIFLAVLMLLTAAPLAGVANTDWGELFAPKAEAATTYKVGDHILYGTYPQSEVKDSALLKKLNATCTLWHYYDYYIESTQTDFMQYRDAMIDGTKYRAVRFSQYRPKWTDGSSSASNSNQYDNGYNTNITYWFRYDPISWRVLDPSTGLIMAETILDSQDYYHFEDNRIIDGKTVYASNYEYSSIRNFLINDFYNTAFTDTQKNNIATTHLENEAVYSTIYDSADTDDKIYLLSYQDMLNTSYGFISGPGYNDTAREAKGSDYAKAQGLWVYRSSGSSHDGNSDWRLRSPYKNDNASNVDRDGYIRSYGYYVSNTYDGIRPTCNLIHLKSDSSTSVISEHNLKAVKAKAATCKATGMKAHYKCSVCGKLFTDKAGTKATTARKLIIAKTGHSYKNIVTKATLTKNGKIIPTCSVCGAKKAATVIPKASNVSVQYSAYAYSGKVKSLKIIVRDSKGKDIASSNYTLSWSNASPKAIGNYTVTVKFKGNYSGSKTLSFKIIPAKVTNLKAAVESKKIRVTATTIKLTWSKVAGAKYYAVQYSKDGKNWSFATKATTATSFIVKNLKAGTKYKFRVKALDSSKKFSGKYSEILTKWTLCANPTITLKSTKSKTATVSWSRLTGAKNYIIATSTNGKDWKKIKTTTALSYTITGLTGGKYIYVKVQAQNADKLNGAYSSVKSVKVKR